ncbi:hypothetical protein BHE74_00044243 [Ensete ventricosum]|nr:hypothetical protein BHE74_00044243 [Ensete ventricosum]RZS05007.1 hypothetical protein BHM03_00035436 [Ensete ventricosum]
MVGSLVPRHGGWQLEWRSSGQEEAPQVGSGVGSCKEVGSGAYIVGAIGHPYLATLLPLCLTMPSYPSTTPVVLAVGRTTAGAPILASDQLPASGRPHRRASYPRARRRDGADPTEQELENSNGARADPTEQELRNWNSLGANMTEHELGNLNGAGADPTEQELGNLNGARADPTEYELGNLNGVGADPTEQELGNLNDARADPIEHELRNLNDVGADPTEQELGNLNGARAYPTEQELGN